MSDPEATAREVLREKLTGASLDGLRISHESVPDRIDNILAALHSAGLMIVARGMVRVSLEDARFIRTAMLEKWLAHPVLDRIEVAIARAEGKP